jgi:hypothetical protein
MVKCNRKTVSDVGSNRLRNTQGFLTKNVKEIFWDLKFLSEVTGCRKTQVADRTGSTVYNNLFSALMPILDIRSI